MKWIKFLKITKIDKWYQSNTILEVMTGNPRYKNNN